MKKWITLLVTILLFSCPMSVFAADPTTDRGNGSQGINVYGSCQNSKDYYEIILGVEEMHTAELPNGITIGGKSDSEEDDKLQVVIIPVTADGEADAYAWMSKSIAKWGKEPTAYYLAFYSGNTQVQPQGKVTITITAHDGYKKTKLFYMDGNAKVKKVSYVTDHGDLDFAMEQTGYYIFAKMNNSHRDSPQTGDITNIKMYFLFISASILILILIFVQRRRKKNSL